MIDLEEGHALFREVWMPKWPYATEHLTDGIHRHTRDNALSMPLIQANGSRMVSLLVVDIDRRDALLRVLSSHGSHPEPFFVIQNNSNGHAHAAWLLCEPVTKTDAGHVKPIHFATACTEGLRRAVGGDRAYSGLMMKNPQHDMWSTQYVTDHAYELAEIRSLLGDNMPERNWTRTRAFRENPTALGRNCALFDLLRQWCYSPSVMRLYLPSHDSDGLEAALVAEAMQLNNTFIATEYGPGPLGQQEVQRIALSIHKWTTRRSRIWRDGIEVYEENLSKRARARINSLTPEERRKMASKGGRGGSSEDKATAGRIGGLRGSHESKVLAGRATRRETQVAGGKRSGEVRREQAKQKGVWMGRPIDEVIRMMDGGL